MGNLFVMLENLLDDNLSDELFESRFARLDVVFDVVVVMFVVDWFLGEEFVCNMFL